jgi:stress response protein YsnF
MTTRAPGQLPLGGSPTVSENAWRVALPVRAEQITITRQTVIRERVQMTRSRVQEVARIEAVLHREELRATASGEAHLTGQTSQEVTKTAPANDSSR